MDIDGPRDPFDCQSTQGPVHDGDYFDAAGFCFSDDEDDEEFGGIVLGLNAHVSIVLTVICAVATVRSREPTTASNPAGAAQQQATPGSKCLLSPEPPQRALAT